MNSNSIKIIKITLLFLLRYLNTLFSWIKREINDKQKEARGIYNVSFNEKKATVIDVEVGIFEDIVIKQLIYYVKGYHNPLRNKGLGSEHIKLHLDENSIGAINIQELISLSTKIREYLNEFKEAFIDDKRAKIYEWQDKKRNKI